MCLLVIGIRPRPGLLLVVAANRDEYYDRPTALAAFWDDHPDVLAGRDLEHHGTWLGITRGGRFAALTNYRDPHRHRPRNPSRGHLVADFLTAESQPRAYLRRLGPVADRYNGFSLLVADTHSMWFYSNRGDAPAVVSDGIHTLSNHLLDTPWPKTRRAADGMRRALRGPRDMLTGSLLDVLADTGRADDAALPDTGVGLMLERALSPVFVTTPAYGTRCSTVLVIDTDGNAEFVERSFDPAGARPVTSAFQFPVSAAAAMPLS